ncbi:AEC family transporter [Thiomicrorhabdus sp.]|uniref:AEC family transporter n=1 Tax=Thiomicrorhabdus sp. TaxID=2039724 RepID=UPI0029C63393|nr:AEC family transporter [Thiomicrorhabdus sp.]
MLNTFSILFPVFALIAAGFISRRVNIMGPAAAGELSRFVVWLALPALLFDIMAKSDWQTMFKPDFILVYIIGSFAVFAAVLLWRLRQGCTLADASVDSVAASYSNTGYIGFPLMLLIFGSVSEVPTAIASVIVVSLLFGGAIVLIESALHAKLAWHLRLLNVLLAVFKNPLVIAPVLGALFAITPYSLPKSIDSFLTILAGAASPAALVSLGLFLADARENEKNNTPAVRNTALGLSFAKLILQPLLVAWLALFVFEMQTDLAMMAIVLAALPTGTGPYMLAEYYQRDGLITAQTILISTVFSLMTLSVLLHFML